MGQFQGVPGPSQDEFDAQTQAIANLDDKLDKNNIAFTAGTNVAIAVQSSFVFNKILFVNAMITVTAAISSGSVLLTLPTGMTIAKRADFSLWNGKNVVCLQGETSIKTNTGNNSLEAATYVLSFPIIVNY